MKNKFEVGQAVWLIPTGNNVKRGKIAEYVSLSAATRQMGRTIENALYRGKSDCFGFIWKYVQ